MKKKFLVGSLLPVLAGAAVVGSGFSLWFFNDTFKQEDQALSKRVTQVVAVGDITKADDFTIVFDQTSEGRTALHLEASTAAADGITIDWAGKTNKTAVYTSVNDNGNGEIDHDDDKIYFSFTTTITITNNGTGKLEDYLNIAYPGAKTSTHENDSNTYQFVLADDVATFDWTKVEFTYVDGKEPKSYAEYNNFKDVVTNATIEVVYRVDVLSK